MKPDDRTVSVRSANGSERSLIENLAQFIYDFSEMEPPRSATWSSAMGFALSSVRRVHAFCVRLFA
jgi:hypothetical protein